MRLRHKINSLISAAFLLFSSAAGAAGIPLIRDAEIEDTLRSFGNPIFEAAGLSPSAVHLFIVSDPTVNAFVAGGQNMFIHTGLILKTDNVGMLLGVMAHETGHMAGGHLAQGAEKLKNAQLGTVLSALLGIAVVAGGGSEAGAAVMSAGQEVSMRNFLHFSRSNESAADQAGLNYLDHLGITSAGMLRMMEVLRLDENRSFSTPDPYTRTHPLSSERISHIRDHVMHSELKETAIPTGYAARHERMLAKLNGFIRPPEETLRRYPESDQSIAARYARAIAWYRIPDLAKSLPAIDSLIKEKPADPFFHELRGQILFENGRIAEAVKSYAEAARLLPRSALILADYGKVLLATGAAADLGKAAGLLERSTTIDNSNSMAWHSLAIAYGRQGKQGMFHLASAEEASVQGNYDEAARNADLALQKLPAQSSGKLRAADIKMIALKEREDARRRGTKPEEESD